MYYGPSAFIVAWDISMNERTRFCAHAVHILVRETENKLNK